MVELDEKKKNVNLRSSRNKATNIQELVINKLFKLSLRTIQRRMSSVVMLSVQSNLLFDYGSGGKVLRRVTETLTLMSRSMV